MPTRLLKIFMIAAALTVIAVQAMADNKIVLGKLGQVTEKTKIYTAPSTRSRVHYTVKAYEYIVVKPKNDEYMAVLLQNGRYGYVKKDSVAPLPYEVTTEQKRPTSRSRDSLLSSRSRGSGVSPSEASAIAQYSMNFIGTKYVWGGNDLKNGIDCSGFVQQLFGKVGERLPRTAAEQVRVGVPVTRLEELRAGDRLYFWDKKRGKVGHTGIYLGQGYFVHSSSNHKGVATDYLGTPKWLGMLVAARRS